MSTNAVALARGGGVIDEELDLMIAALKQEPDSDVEETRYRDAAFTMVTSAVLRQDAESLSVLAGRLSTMSALCRIRGRRQSESLERAGYFEALADVSHVFTSHLDTGTAMAVVRSRKHVLSLMHVLNKAQAPVTSGALASELGIAANNLTGVVHVAADAGLVHVSRAGRNSFVRLSGLGMRCLREACRPAAGLAVTRLLDEMIAWSVKRRDSDDITDHIVRSFDVYPEDKTKALLAAADDFTVTSGLWARYTMTLSEYRGRPLTLVCTPEGQKLMFMTRRPTCKAWIEEFAEGRCRVRVEEHAAQPSRMLDLKYLWIQQGAVRLLDGDREIAFEEVSGFGEAVAELNSPEFAALAGAPASVS